MMGILTERDINLDAIKGWGIILVVLGHAIQVSCADFDNCKLFEIIYSFHMPLFIFISGYVTYRETVSKINLRWLKKRAQLLLIPFFSWIVIPYIVSWKWKTLLNEIIVVLKCPDKGLWFLLVLFFNCFLLYLVILIKVKLNIRNETYILIVLILILNIVYFIYPITFLGFDLLVKYSLYYFSGYLFKKYINTIKSKMNIAVLWILSILFVFIVPFWKRTEIPSFMLNLNMIDLPHACITIIWLIFNIVVAYLGIAFSFALIQTLPIRMKKLLSFFGRYSLEIYVLHKCFFMKMPYSNDVGNVMLNFIIPLSASLLIIWIIKNNKLSLLLFGKKYDASK